MLLELRHIGKITSIHLIFTAPSGRNHISLVECQFNSSVQFLMEQKTCRMLCYSHSSSFFLDGIFVRKLQRFATELHQKIRKAGVKSCGGIGKLPGRCRRSDSTSYKLNAGAEEERASLLHKSTGDWWGSKLWRSSSHAAATDSTSTFLLLLSLPLSLLVVCRGLMRYEWGISQLPTLEFPLLTDGYEEMETRSQPILYGPFRPIRKSKGNGSAHRT